MKPLTVAILILLFSAKLFSQSAEKYLSKQELAGIWQRYDSLVGSGIGQNFHFKENNTFVLNLGSDEDDARDITQLKGTYRLVKNEIYFTIKSRTVIDGNIVLSDGGISLNLFDIHGKGREIPEKTPKEFSVPCDITFLSQKHIKINAVSYYKVK
jgi:hypothetical protein